MAKYHITKKAVADLDSIWDYTANTWSERQADNYYSELVMALNRIASQPKYLDREYPEIHPGLYCRHCKKHLIFYRTAEDNLIEIVRILHERMDIVSKF